MKTKILLIDDNKSKLSALKLYLEKEYYDVVTATNGQTGLNLLEKIKPDIILLDVHMPGMDGIDTCRQIRSRQAYSHGKVGIIMFSDKRIDLVDKVSGLDLGADRYLVRPVAPRELLAEIKALERIIDSMQSSKSKASNKLQTLIIDNRLKIHLDERVVEVSGEKRNLQPLLYNILVYLAHPPNRARSKEDLIWEFWAGGPDYDTTVDENALSTAISRLRNEIESDPRHPVYIVTVHGYGYKLNKPT
ncbi:MAG: response regulator transcription factor [Chloroflexi bacterium]|nr:response regulator transcription factor [Chloroflexota bacterium]